MLSCLKAGKSADQCGGNDQTSYLLEKLDDCADDNDCPAVYPETPLSCAGRCGKYTKGAKCQCDGKCSQYKDCCSDYTKLCTQADLCGNGKCDAGETASNCAKDCGATTSKLVQCAMDKCSSEHSACLKDSKCKATIDCAVKCDSYYCLNQCAANNYTKATIDIGNCVAVKGCLDGLPGTSSGGGSSGGSSSGSSGGGSSGGGTEGKPCKHWNDCGWGYVCCSKSSGKYCVKAGKCWSGG